MAAKQVVLKVGVEFINDVLQQFDVIEVHRSTAGIGGAYTEITNQPGDPRIALDGDVNLYEFTDTAGDTDYYYKYRYRNSTTGALSPFSSPVRGLGTDADEILTVDELLQFYLFGVDLTDDFGTPYPTEMFEFYIRAAISRAEKELDLDLVARSRSEEYDYWIHDYNQFGMIKLDHPPVQSVEKITIRYPSAPEAVEFPSEWYHLDPAGSVVRVIPGGGNLSQVLLGAGGAWLPLLQSAYSQFPHLWTVEYTSGFVRGAVPDDIKHAIAMIASMGPLNIAGDLLGGAGIASQSIGVPGVNQSFNTTSSATNSGYGARIIQYAKELKTMIPYLRSYYHGIKLEGV